MKEQTVKCNICGEPYNFYPGNQSAGPQCIQKANKKAKSRGTNKLKKSESTLKRTWYDLHDGKLEEIDDT